MIIRHCWRTLSREMSVSDLSYDPRARILLVIFEMISFVGFFMMTS